MVNTNMDFAQFQAGLAALLFIPEGQKGRSLAVAKALADADRLEFLRHLREVDRQLKEAVEGQEKAVADEAMLVTTAERKMIAWERGKTEAKSHVEEMRVAEGHLSSQS